MVHESTLSESWELIYYDGKAESNGRTDFAALPTEKRVEFLHQYAEKAKSWFGDPRLETAPVTGEEVAEALNRLKERPLPKIRRRITLETWRYSLQSMQEAFHEREFNDSAWPTLHVPKLFSPERKDGNLRLRKSFNIDGFRTAMLVVESLPDYSRVWVNGHLVRDTTVGVTGRADGRYEPFRIDITKYLTPNSPNVIAIEVLHQTERLQGSSDFPPSTCTEAYGVAGKIFLDLTDDRIYVADPFLRAADVADPCTVKATFTLINLDEEESFSGSVEIGLYEWFLTKSTREAASEEVLVAVPAGGSDDVNMNLRVPSPALWTPQKPSLYLARIVVRREGREVDECLETFGIRTIEGRDGHLYLNDRKFFAKGVGAFNRFPPLEEAKVNVVYPPDRPLMGDLLAFKKMNGKVMRVHGRVKNTNSSRMLDMCDQLGILLVWPTMAWWNKEDLGGREAYEGTRRIQLPPSVKHVRNHPSIMAWEGANEPGNVRSKAHLWDDFYRAVRPLDDSRLIDPVSMSQFMGRRPKSWEAREVYWGYHTYAGWYSPFAGITLPFSRDLERWYSEEDNYWYGEHRRPIIHTEIGAEGMPKWPLYTKEPWYKVWEDHGAWKQEADRIGRNLDKDLEWEESQAYQGLVLQHYITMLRTSGADGVYVVGLADGWAFGRYHKGVLDLYRRAKIGYYIVGMSYQDILVTSTNGDVVLGRDDALSPRVVNDGEERKVTLRIEVRDVSGQIVDTKVYPNVVLAGETAVTSLSTWKPALPKTGYYSMECRVLASAFVRGPGAVVSRKIG